MTEVQKMYIALFGRVGEKDGLEFWQRSGLDGKDLANAMLETPESKDFWKDASNKDFIESIYSNLLNKDSSTDAEGINYWASQVDAGMSRGEVVNHLLYNALNDSFKDDPKAAKDFQAKLEIADYYAKSSATGKDAIADDYQFSKDILKTTNASNVDAQKAKIDKDFPADAKVLSDWNSMPADTSNPVELTVNTDEVTANYIVSGMKYTPGGNDLVSTLQDEDVIRGIDGRTDNTIKAVIGDGNDESAGSVLTPQLDNIQNVNLQMTGDLGRVNLRYAKDIQKLNVEKVHENAFVNGNASVDGIRNDVDLRLADVYKLDGNFAFKFNRDALEGTKDEGNLYLDDVKLNSLTVNDITNTYGYETLNLRADNGVRLNTLNLSELETLNLSGTGRVQILEENKPVDVGDIRGDELNGQYYIYDGGIVNNGNIGVSKVDLSKFDGSETIIGLNGVDGANLSREGFEYIGSKGNDKLVFIGMDIEKNSTVDGGEGENTIVLIDSSFDPNSIKNFKITEVKIQKDNSSTIDVENIADLEEIVVRNENPDVTEAPKFEVKNVTKDQAVVIEHSVDTKINENATAGKDKDNVDAIDLEVKTIAAKDVDTANFVVRPAKGFKDTQDGFNYRIDANNSADKAIANVTIDDQDSENNFVEFASENKGTITLKGGEAGDKYIVRSDLDAKVVDASAQKSDLYLSIKNQIVDGKAIDQEVKLGSGNDTVVFSEVNALDNVALSDAGGNDTVKAYFNKDTSLDLKGIETLHTLATKSIKIDLGKASDLDTLVLLSDKAGQAIDGELANDGFENPFDLGSEKVTVNDIITLENADIKVLNFQGDINKLDLKANGELLDGKSEDDHFDRDQTFNGVNINASKAEDLKLNVDASLDVTSYLDANGKVVNVAVDNYNIGHIAAKNVKTMDIAVANDDEETNTNMNGIFSDALETLTAKTEGNLNIGAITNTSAAKPTLKTVDFTNVGGKTTATINILADDAKVITGDGGSSLFAEGSNGKNILFDLGKGDDFVVSGANNETFRDAGGNNYIRAGVGNNTIDMLDTKAGNDIIITGYGKDTITVGGGFDRVIDGFYSDKVVEDTENTIVNNSGVVRVLIDSKSVIKGDSNQIGSYDHVLENLDTIATGDIVDQYFASVSETLSINYKGNELSASSTLGGRLANGIEVNNQTGKLQIKDGDIANLLKTTDGNDFILIGVNDIKDGYLTFADDAVNTKVEASKGDDVIIATKAQTTALDIKGGEGDDAIVVYATAAHKIEGGAGADTIVIGNGGSAVELTINAKDSTVDAYDTIYNLSGVAADVKGLGELTFDVNALDLDKLKVTTTDKSKVTATIDNTGLVKAVNEDNTDFIVNKGNLKDAISVLKGAMTDAADNKAFMFKYDANNDGEYGQDDSIFVFINNSDQTLIEFAGVDANSVNDLANIANFIA